MEKTPYKVPELITLTHQPCWCSHTSANTLFETDRYGQKLRSVICKKCGTIRLDPRLKNEESAAYYNTDYANNQLSTEEFYMQQIKQNATIHIKKYIKKDGTILDYGCGPGGKLASLVSEGYSVYGFDLNEQYRSFAFTKGLKPYEQTMQYDCLYLSHTLEHWLDPMKDLSRLISTHLKDEGTLIIEVPLLDRLLLGVRPNGIHGEIYFVHTWYFSVSSLDKLMAQIHCKREYTNRVTFCIYKYSKNKQVSPITTTTLKDWSLRKGISVASTPGIRTVARLLNSLTHYIDVYHSPELN